MIARSKIALGAAGIVFALSLSGHSLAAGEPATAGATATAKPAPGADAAKLAKGKDIFASAGCAMCHTLAAADASGAIGPSLDHNPAITLEHVSQMVKGGGGTMPAFAGQLSDDDIAAVSAYVAGSAAK